MKISEITSKITIRPDWSLHPGEKFCISPEGVMYVFDKIEHMQAFYELYGKERGMSRVNFHDFIVKSWPDKKIVLNMFAVLHEEGWADGILELDALSVRAKDLNAARIILRKINKSTFVDKVYLDTDSTDHYLADEDAVRRFIRHGILTRPGSRMDD